MISNIEIMELIRAGNNDKLYKVITKAPFLVNEKTDQGISILQYAAYCRNKSAVEILRKHKWELDIYEAASIGDTETINQHIDKMPGLVNSFSPDGFTLLGLASFFGHFDIVKVLLEKGANPNIVATNPLKVAPIHSACAISNYDIAEILIKYQADVNAKQTLGVTPLHSAAHNGNTKLVKLIIDNGADINAKTDNGQTPLAMAEEKNFQETAELIRKCGGQ